MIQKIIECIVQQKSTEFVIFGKKLFFYDTKNMF